MLHITCMNKETFFKYLKRRATTGKPLSTKELKRYYNDWSETPVHDSSFRVMIHRLKKRGQLVSIKRGMYKLGSSDRFTLPVSRFEKEIFEDMKEKFPFAELIIWSTTFFDRYSSLQTVKTRTIVEVSSGSEDSVFAHLQKDYDNGVFLKPDEETYLNYVSQLEHPVIIKSVISESPIIETDGVKVPAIEKIIVDFYADEIDFLPWLSERPRIIRELFNDTTVNLSTLMRYAARRNRKAFFKEWLRGHQLVNPDLLQNL